MITGNYPQKSGIVNNSFYDPDMREGYKIGHKSMENPKFYNGKPFWHVVEDNGLKSASYFWLASDIPVNGQLPSYYRKFNKTTPDQKIFDQAIKWFEIVDVSKRPN